MTRRFLGMAKSGQEIGVETENIWIYWNFYFDYTIIAEDLQGNTLYSKTFPFEELKAQKYRVIITT